MVEMKRIATGVKGLDALLEGGIPEGNIVLVSGSTGAGKTFLGLQYLYHGALNGEPGLYITLDERSENLMKVINSMNLDTSVLDERFQIVDGAALRKVIGTAEERARGGILDLEHLTKLIGTYIEGFGIKRVVLDSLTAVAFRYEDTAEFRFDLFRFCDYLKEQEVTTLLIVEVEEGSAAVDRFGVESFISDGVIVLKFEERDYDLNPTILVRKMRYTDHPTVRFNYSISEKGLQVHEKFI